MWIINYIHYMYYYMQHVYQKKSNKIEKCVDKANEVCYYSIVVRRENEN